MTTRNTADTLITMHYVMGSASMLVSELSLPALAYRVKLTECPRTRFGACRCACCREIRACRIEAVRRLDAVQTRDELRGLGVLATVPATIEAFSRAVERTVEVAA